MKNVHSALHHVIDLKKWQSLQDSLALVTKMSLITIDYKGTPVTDHSSCCDFCKYVRHDPSLLSLCKKCDSRGGLEAVRANKPYIYYCHFNIIDVAIPIIINDTYVGAVMAGQVKLPPHKEDTLEKLLHTSKSGIIEDTLETLEAEYERIPILSLERIKTISEMLYHLCNYIVEEAIDKQLSLESYTARLYSGQTRIKSEEISGFSVEHIKKVKKEVSNTLINAYVSETQTHPQTSLSPLLQPALDYIYQHKSENISLKKAAELCHISPSYFSRIFCKATGENFSTYLSKLKIQWSKELLETSDMTVNQISDTLGFNDAGYLIKKFKAHIGITPAVYRNNLPR
ncbi:PocR ligand-binding domain-containing protein [Cellulosilyticum sp. I15G10I2]|uniref:PocR ligand-binding domain-containing protein n=1 Tax=Cellulosilyticum sp. I15G10I2 TaxID=1892843 RepID=UPI00085BD520|nr:PocR ligand-binding domain-containing protein [Cellulosilyticum sp. I15G10I2]